MAISFDAMLRVRLSVLALESVERGGGGDCWWVSIGAETGESGEVLRRGVSQFMRENENVYGKFGNYETFGGYQRYCDMVATPGVYVEGNAEVAATADYIGRHILILGADSARDVYIFAGSIGLGAPIDLGDEQPILAHWLDLQHYTGTRPHVYEPWCAPKGAKRARIEAIRASNIAEFAVAASALATVILRARDIAVDARI